jgi:hypothetical protein
MIFSTALRLLRSLIPILPLLVSSANAAEALQTQATADGDVQVEVIQVAADQRILTVQLAYRNTSNVDVGIKYPVSGVYYIDERERKKIPGSQRQQRRVGGRPDGFGQYRHAARLGSRGPPTSGWGKVDRVV